MSNADLIGALRLHGSMATQRDVDAFVEASDELSEGTEPLDQGDVVALLGALDAGDDHPEVRWTVLHIIESQDATSYLLGTLDALATNARSEWAGLLVGRLANAPALWPAMAGALAGASAEAKAKGVAGIRALAATLDGGKDSEDRERARKVASLADALAEG